MKCPLSWWSDIMSYHTLKHVFQQCTILCSRWWNFAMISLVIMYRKKNSWKTAPLNSYILGFASHNRFKCVHSQIPPRRPASFIQLVWHKPVSCNSLSLNITVSPPICLASDWRACRPCFSYELLESQLFAANTFLAKVGGASRILLPLSSCASKRIFYRQNEPGCDWVLPCYR